MSVFSNQPTTVFFRVFCASVIAFCSTFGFVRADSLICPITELPYASMSGSDESVTVEDTWMHTVVLTNPSESILPNLQIGVGLYSDKDATEPDYWITLPDMYTLSQKSEKRLDLQVGLNYLPAGTYTLRLFTGQGDTFAPLGNALMGSTAPYIQITKTTQSTTQLKLETKTSGGEVVDGTFVPWSAVTTVTNTSKDEVVRDVSFRERIAFGRIPVGAAVTGEQTTELRIIPERTQRLEITDPLQTENEYTYIGMISGGTEVAPLTIVRSVSTEMRTPAGTPYISAIGLSAYPTGEPVTAVACVSRIGVTGLDTSAPISVGNNETLTLSAFTGDSADDKKLSEISTPLTVLERNQMEAVALTIDAAVPQLVLEATLRQNRYETATDVSTMRVNSTCDEFEVCTNPSGGDVTTAVNTSVSPFIFFRLAAILTIILAAYVLLRYLFKKLP